MGEVQPYGPATRSQLAEPLLELRPGSEVQFAAERETAGAVGIIAFGYGKWRMDQRRELWGEADDSQYTKSKSRMSYREKNATTVMSHFWVNSARMPAFGFLTNHGLALLCIAKDPEVRMRDIAADVQITERAAQRIVAELIDSGYLDRERVGRRNRYTVRTGLPVSLPAQRDIDLNALLNVLLPAISSDERKLAMPHAAVSS